MKHQGIPSIIVLTVDATAGKALDNLRYRHPSLQRFSLDEVTMLMASIPASFCWHALSIAVDEETFARPLIKPGFDCYVWSATGLERIGLGCRVSWDFRVTVIVAYRYAPEDQNTVNGTGLFVVPTRNVGEEFHVAAPGTQEPGNTIDTPTFRYIKSFISRENHKEVQLTFPPDRFPSRVIAESVYNAPEFMEEMGHLRDWSVAPLAI